MISRARSFDANVQSNRPAHCQFPKSENPTFLPPPDDSIVLTVSCLSVINCLRGFLTAWVIRNARNRSGMRALRVCLRIGAAEKTDQWHGRTNRDALPRITKRATLWRHSGTGIQFDVVGSSCTTIMRG